MKIGSFDIYYFILFYHLYNKYLHIYIIFIICSLSNCLPTYLLVNQSRKIRYTFGRNLPCLVKVSYSFFFGREKWEWILQPGY